MTPSDYDKLTNMISFEGQKRFGPNFSIAEIDKPVIKKLLTYVIRDSVAANEEGIDLNKGLMLRGPIGCGKTSLMRILYHLGPDTFKPVIKACEDISLEFADDGFHIISRYSNNSFNPYSHVPKAYCFDDLGQEPMASYWGNNQNVMLTILTKRYELFHSHKMITHATTNLNSKELEEIYGNRLRSRMKSMFNIIAFDPESGDKRK